MKIVLSIQNHQALCGLYVFDDGTLFVIDEKACSMIDSGGTVTESWWKEEPYMSWLKEDLSSTHLTRPS